MENSKFVKLLSLLIAIILTFGTFGGCNKKTPESASSQEADNQKDTVEEVPKDDGYSAFISNPRLMRDNDVNNNYKAPKETSIILHGKTLTAEFDHTDEGGDNYLSMSKNEVYSRSYFYSNDLSLYRDSRGVLVSYMWHPNKFTMDQIIPNFVDASKILTVEECQKEAVDFLVANSIETKGYRLKSEPILDEENKTYTFTWVRYVGEEPTLDTYSVIVMQNGFVRRFGGTLINCVPYYEENPINIFEARKAAAQLMAEKYISRISNKSDILSFEEVVIYFTDEYFDGNEYQITYVPGYGIAVVFLMGIKAVDPDYSDEPPYEAFWDTWLQYVYVTI